MAKTTDQILSVLASGDHSSLTANDWTMVGYMEAQNNAAAAAGAATPFNYPTSGGGGTAAPAPSGSGSTAPAYTGPTAEEIAAAQDAARKEAARNSVWDDMQAMLSQWDIGGDILGTIRNWVWEDRSADYILMEFRKTEAYNKRFPGMAALIARGQFMQEAEYIALERAYRNLMAQWDLPKGFYDSYDDFGGYIANGVSVAELDDRIESAKTILDNDTDPEYRRALRSLGAGQGDLLAYVIDPNKAQKLVEKKLRTAAFAGAAELGGFSRGGYSAALYEKYGEVLGEEYNDISREELAKLQARVGAAGVIADRDKFLSALDRETFAKTDILDAEFLGDTDKALASQRRAERERNRFSKKSGIGRNALGSASDESGF